MKDQEKKYYLIKSGETWTVSRSGDLSQDNVERVAVNLSSGVITLTALPPNTQGLGNFSKNEWPCYKGLVFNPAVRAFRRADSYSLCKSEFTKNIDNPLTMAGGAVTAIIGVVRSLVAIDQEKILAIAESSGLIEMVEQDRQVATGAEYHALFAAATTPG